MGFSVAEALCSSEAAALALRGRGYGFTFFAGLPEIPSTGYAITVVQDTYPAYRSSLTPAWQVDRKWQAVEPGERWPVISQPILCATVSVAQLWGWQD